MKGIVIYERNNKVNHWREIKPLAALRVYKAFIIFTLIVALYFPDISCDSLVGMCIEAVDRADS